MKSYVLVCCLIVGAIAAPTDVGHNGGRKCQCDGPGGSPDSATDLAQSHRLDELLHEFLMLKHKYDVGTERADGVIEDMDDLKHTIETLEGHGCEKYKEFQCGGDQPHCISNLLVCDGDNDCENGADEAHCAVTANAGSTWTGYVVYDHCTQRRPDTIQMKINSVSTVPYFTARPKVTGSIMIQKHTKDYDSWTSLPVTGYWAASEGSVVLFPPENDRLGLVCTFHGHDHDTCTGLIVRESIWNPCAEFTFHRD